MPKHGHHVRIDNVKLTRAYEKKFLVSMTWNWKVH